MTLLSDFIVIALFWILNSLPVDYRFLQMLAYSESRSRGTMYSTILPLPWKSTTSGSANMKTMSTESPSSGFIAFEFFPFENLTLSGSCRSASSYLSDYSVSLLLLDFTRGGRPTALFTSHATVYRLVLLFLFSGNLATGFGPFSTLSTIVLFNIFICAFCSFIRPSISFLNKSKLAYSIEGVKNNYYDCVCSNCGDGPGSSELSDWAVVSS